MKYQEEGAITPEKAIKMRGHELMMKLNNAGVPWDKCNLAALVVAFELKSQFRKLFKGPQVELTKHLEQFDKLETGIKGFLPMPKEEILSRFIGEIEAAFNEAESMSQFKEKVLTIVRSPKTKFKLFI